MIKKKVTLVVPCFNEEEVIPYFYQEFLKIALQLMEYELAVLFIDDGSKDGTLDLVKGLAEKDSRIKYISFSRNFGKESAIYAGLENTDSDYVVLMDADLQDPPSLLPDMLKAVRDEGYDSAATRRVNRKGEPPIRSFLHVVFII